MAARLIHAGGQFWGTPDGGLAVARGACLVNLSKRLADKVCALLSINPSDAPQRLASGHLPLFLSRLLEDATLAAMATPDTLRITKPAA